MNRRLCVISWNGLKMTQIFSQTSLRVMNHGYLSTIQKQYVKACSLTLKTHHG